MPSANFIVYALPRSRTFWTKHFLSYGPWYCGHDEIRYVRSMDDIHNWLTMPFEGTVETLAAPFWRTVAGVRTATIRRPVDETVESMRRLGYEVDWDIYRQYMVRLDRKLDQIEHRLPGVLRVEFDELATEAGCARLFEHCLGLPHDHEWWAKLAPINIQCHLGHYFRQTVAYAEPMRKMASLAKFHTLQSMNRNFPIVDQDDGLTIRVEAFKDAYDEAMKLAPEHCVASGESPDFWQEMNWPVIAELAETGHVQCVIARSNGRMFGYLLTLISPSIEKAGIEQAVHTAFFADTKHFRNLGIKMQRVALDALKERGVSELLMRAGVRGDGPRMSVLYKRLGAKPFGEWFKLELR